MPNILYKLDTIVSKMKYKFSKNKILNSKITISIVLLIFIASLSTIIYIYINNNHKWFQRFFEQSIFEIDNAENKILFISIIS